VRGVYFFVPGVCVHIFLLLLHLRCLLNNVILLPLDSCFFLFSYFECKIEKLKMQQQEDKDGTKIETKLKCK
jgi:hypothetical protein